MEVDLELSVPIHLCPCVLGDGEGVVSPERSLLSDTLRYINLTNVVMGPIGPMDTKIHRSPDVSIGPVRIGNYFYFIIVDKVRGRGNKIKVEIIGKCVTRSFVMSSSFIDLYLFLHGSRYDTFLVKGFSLHTL